MDRKDEFIVACIPTYCEEGTIARVILSSQKYVDKVIVCDDGSTDMTGEIAGKLGAVVVRHKKNLGKGHAMKTLFGTAMKLNANVIVLIDGDGQHDPDDIPSLIEPILESKADIVLGSRYVNNRRIDAPLYRRLGLRFLNYLHKTVNRLDITDAECGFRALSRKALDAIYFFEQGGYGADAGMLSLAKKNGITVTEVPIVVKYKGLKKTSKRRPLFHGGELIASLLRTVIDESPLKYLGLPGTILISIGMIASIYVILLYNESKWQFFSLPVFLIAWGSIVTGLLLAVAGIIMWGLQRVSNKIKDLQMSRSLEDSDEQEK